MSEAHDCINGRSDPFEPELVHEFNAAAIIAYTEFMWYRFVHVWSYLKSGDDCIFVLYEELDPNTVLSFQELYEPLEYW